MLRNKDILELKRRFKKENCTITRMCGCYVDASKNKVVELSETFLNLEDEEFFKYLEIAKKTLSGTFWSCILQARRRNPAANSSICWGCARAGSKTRNY